MKIRDLLDRLDEIGGKYANVYPTTPPIEEDEEIDEEVLDEEDEEEDK